jgi:hypothetical protein
MKTLILTLIFLLSFSSNADDKWFHLTKKDGIDIYSRVSKDSPIKSLRAEGIINGSLAKIVSIMRDVNSATDWVPNLKSRSYVKNVSDTEAILYDISIMPWPVTNRDLVVHHRLSLSPDKKSLVLNFNSIRNTERPVKKKPVRATIHTGSIEFYPRGDKTLIKLVLLVDPNGKIPKWVVNLLQVSMPYEFLMSLNKFASKSKLTPLPGIQKLIDQIE